MTSLRERSPLLKGSSIFSGRGSGARFCVRLVGHPKLGPAFRESAQKSQTQEGFFPPFPSPKTQTARKHANPGHYLLSHAAEAISHLHLPPHCLPAHTERIANLIWKHFFNQVTHVLQVQSCSRLCPLSAQICELPALEETKC